MDQTLDLHILIATHNQGKVREIQEMLRGLQVSLRTLDDFANITSVEEVGRTYKENASLKALGYARQTGLFALADDSGLEVEALGGMPGLFSARFGGELISDRERIQKLLVALSDYSSSKRAAKFVCSMALAGWSPQESQSPGPRLLNITEATCDGFIASRMHGDKGFGFDPVFVPLGSQQTFAELPSEIKSKISHRAKALTQMRVFLEDLLGTGPV